MKVPRDIFIPSTKFHATDMHLTDEDLYLYKNTAKEIELCRFFHFTRTRSLTARLEKEQQYIQEYFLKRYSTIPITISLFGAWEWHGPIVKMSFVPVSLTFSLCLPSWRHSPPVSIPSMAHRWKHRETETKRF